MKKLSKNLTKMTPQELILKLYSDPNESEKIADLAYQKNLLTVLYEITKMPDVLFKEKAPLFITKKISQNRDSNFAINAMKRILSYPSQIIEAKISEKALNLIQLACISSPILSAIALLSEGTPESLTAKIITQKKLADTKATSLKNKDPILSNIIGFMIQGAEWKNHNALLLLGTRTLTDPSDSFILEASKHNLSMQTFELMADIAKSTQNYTLVDNLNKNESSTKIKYEFEQGLKLIGASAMGKDYAQTIASSAEKLIERGDGKWVWETMRKNTSLFDISSFTELSPCILELSKDKMILREMLIDLYWAINNGYEAMVISNPISQTLVAESLNYPDMFKDISESMSKLYELFDIPYEKREEAKNLQKDFYEQNSWYQSMKELEDLF